MSDNALPNTAESAWKPYLPYAHPLIWDALRESLIRIYSEDPDPRGFLKKKLDEIERIKAKPIEPTRPIIDLTTDCKIEIDFMGGARQETGRPEVISDFLETLPDFGPIDSLTIPTNEEAVDGSPTVVYTFIGDEMWTGYGMDERDRVYLTMKESLYPNTNAYVFGMTYLSLEEVHRLKSERPNC